MWSKSTHMMMHENGKKNFGELIAIRQSFLPPKFLTIQYICTLHRQGCYGYFVTMTSMSSNTVIISYSLYV